jgi:transcription initiation factor TFIIIB Brf1 subunit/transcription initiation factor TFIIB
MTSILDMPCLHDERLVCIDEGQRVCSGCGTILTTVIDEGPEWRYYGADDRNEDPTRTGNITNELLPESSYGSAAVHKRGTLPEFRYLEKLSAWSLASHVERSWLTAFDILQTTGQRYGLPKAILQDACHYLRSIPDALKLRGETRRALMGASLFMACRRHAVSRTHEEIAALFRVSTRSLCKAIQHFEPPAEDNSILKTQLSLAERMMDAMKLNDVYRNDVLDKIRVFFSGEDLEHTPKVIVAGIIASYLLKDTPDAHKQGRLKELSKQSGVSVVSIQKILKKV